MKKATHIAFLYVANLLWRETGLGLSYLGIQTNFRGRRTMRNSLLDWRIHQPLLYKAITGQERHQLGIFNSGDIYKQRIPDFYPNIGVDPLCAFCAKI